MESKHEIPADLKTVYVRAIQLCGGSKAQQRQGQFRRNLIERIASLEAALAKARSQIEAAQNFAAQLESNIKFLNERVDKAEAQLADYGKPVTNEEWNFDDELLPTPALKEMFKRMRATFDDLLRRRTQSRQPMSERSAEE